MDLPGDSYWVEEGLLLAGPYPGDPDPGSEREKLGAFLALGIKRFVDLTEPKEHPPYAATLAHCRGGAGRTGTVVGCFLIERGDAPARALAEISADRDELSSRRRAWSSPETEEQRRFVLEWGPGRS